MQRKQTLGILHPGAMGVTVAAAAAECCSVLWASEGRSQATRDRAQAAGLADAGSVAGLVRRSDVIVSVCPPAEALAVAEAVAGHGFAGIFVDANAVSPLTAREIGACVARSGARAVDGGLIGPPAHSPGTTTLHLSGPEAAAVAACFEGSPLEPQVVAGEIGAASALKMAFAAWTKGQAALLLGVAALARAYGVEEALHARWERGMGDLPARTRATAAATAPKAWRFEAEMREIAATFAAAGLPDGFHAAAADLYSRLGAFKDADPGPDLDAVTRALRRPVQG